MSNLSLRGFSTIKIGGLVEQLVLAHQLTSELLLALPKPIRILGNGSNTLIDDSGLRGTVIVTRQPVKEKMDVLVEVTEETALSTTVRVPSGTYMPTFAQWALSQRLSGVEYMI